MANPAVILAICGSLRAESYDTKLLSEAAAGWPSRPAGRCGPRPAG
ncbi:MAG: hypothetical protein ACR2JQ_02980 [Mycobacteriales bacterium]